MKIYTAETRTITGQTILVAVEADNEHNARTDLLTAIQAETHMPFGAFRLRDLRRRTRKLISDMFPIRRCTINNQPWAWMKFID